MKSAEGSSRQLEVLNIFNSHFINTKILKRMRKHFLLLFLMALLPLASFAAPAPDYTVGDYTVTFAAKPYVAIAETPSATAIPTFTLAKGGSDIPFTIVDLRYQSIGNKVNQISAAGTYFQKITFIDGTTEKTMYVPFYVSETYDVDYVNNETSFNASLANGFLKKYYEKWPMCDVDWIYGNGANDRVILYPGQYPTSTPGTKNETGSLPNWATTQKDEAIAWANEIFGSTYSAYNIAHTWAAFSAVATNVPAFGFVFPNLSGEYNVVITDGTNSHTWDASTDNPMKFTAGKYSWTSPTADLNTWGITTTTPANVKYIVYPTNLESLAYVPDYSQAVDISNVPVFININSTALNYKDSQNEPTIDNVTVGEITYSSTEWPQLFTLQYYKIVNGVAVKQNADQVQNAGTYAVALVSKGATDADRSITYTIDKESSKAEFVINKINLEITLGDGSKQYGDADPDELPVTAGTLPEGCVSIPDFTFNSLPRTANENVSSTGYAYAFTLNDATQTDITAQNYNLIIKNQPKLTISKKDIVLNYKASAAQPSKTYGVATLNTEFTNGIKNKANYEVDNTIAGNALVGTDDLATVLAGITANGKVTTAFNYVGGIESANADKEGTAFTTTTPVAHKLTITIDQNVAANYNFTVNKVALTVKQAKLTVGTGSKFTFTKTPTTNLTYNGAAQSVQKKLVYNADTDITALDETVTPNVTGQFTVSYKYKTAATADTESTIGTGNNEVTNGTAGYYVAYITPVANKNYYIDGESLAVPAFDFTIDKKPLYLYVKNEEIKETYKGAPYDLPTSAGITFQGLIANDASVQAGDITAVKAVKFGTTDVVTLKDAGEYDIIPYVAEGNSLNTNYDVQPYSTKFTINPLAITIAPKNMLDVVYGTPIAGTFAATVDATTPSVVVGNVTVTKNNASDPAIEPADLTKVLAAYNVVVADQTYAAGETYPAAITLEQKTLVPATTTAQNDQAIIDMLKNFTITPGTGNVSIANGTYTIIAKDQNVTYGDELTWSKFTYLVSGLPASTKPASVKYILVDANANEYSQNDDDDLPVNAGTYTIKVDAQNSQLAIANYDAPSLTDGTLTIAPKQLIVVTAEVKVNAGASVADLNTLGKSKVTFTGLEDGDAIAYKLAFNTSVVSTNATTGNLTSAALDNAYVNGYKVVAMTAAEIATAGVEFANKNYTFKFGAADAATTIDAANATGNLMVVTGNLLALADDAQVIDRINIAAEKCAADNTGNTLYNVEVTDRSLNLEKWNVVVLPFDITPYEFTQAIGRYAVFNTLESANTANNTVTFKLQLNNLKANEPFLVKPEKTKTDAAATETIALTQFNDRYIVAPANGVPQKTDVAGVKFVGTYNAFDLKLDEDWTGDVITSNSVKYIADGGAAGSEISYLSGGKFVTATKTISGTKYSRETLGVTFTRAYLDFNESALSAPLITVEEADGSTTAISEITAEGVAVAAEGWYTIDGIKLQGVPTQKGVYINNGKKIVVK